MTVDDFASTIDSAALSAHRRARAHSTQRLITSREVISRFLDEKGIDSTRVGFPAVGSVGRQEALESSDFDLLPVAADEETHALVVNVYGELRSQLQAEMRCEVSEGTDLLRATRLATLCNGSEIGGSKDSRTALTQRILLLTESAVAGGDLQLDYVRRRIIDAYADQQAPGRHPMAYCNDLARYYRTTCLDYKAKFDTKPTNWCTRNVKLRNARKFWYFSSLVDVALIPSDIDPHDPRFVNEIMDGLRFAPIDRCLRRLPPSAHDPARRLLNSYGRYLGLMADNGTRSALAELEYERRHEQADSNPFPALQANSKEMHTAMISLMGALPPPAQERIQDWFLL